MTTLPGKSAFPEDHPLALGTGGYSGTAAVEHTKGARPFGRAPLEGMNLS